LFKGAEITKSTAEVAGETVRKQLNVTHEEIFLKKRAKEWESKELRKINNKTGSGNIQRRWQPAFVVGGQGKSLSPVSKVEGKKTIVTREEGGLARKYKEKNSYTRKTLRGKRGQHRSRKKKTLTTYD